MAPVTAEEPSSRQTPTIPLNAAMPADLTTFQQYYALADQLIAQSSKETLAECARLLALNLAHYEMRYGALPLDETLAALSGAEPNDDQAELLTRGMENLVGLLGNVLSGLGEERH